MEATITTIQDHLTNLSRKELIDYCRANNLKTIEGLLPDQQIKVLKTMTDDQVRDEIRRVEALKAALPQSENTAETADTTQENTTADTVAENTAADTSNPETTDTEEGKTETTDTEEGKTETTDTEEGKTETTEEGKTETTPAPAPAPAKPDKAPKGPGVIATIIQILKDAAPNGISDADGKKKLAAAFPDRKSEAVGNTYKLQVPKRLKNEKGLNVVSGPNGYYIAPTVPVPVVETAVPETVEAATETSEQAPLSE